MCVFRLIQTTDIQTLSAHFLCFESIGNSLKALSAKACKPLKNTNTSMPAAQHVFTGFERC